MALGDALSGIITGANQFALASPTQFAASQYAPPPQISGALSNPLAEWILVLVGIIIIAIAFDRNSKFGTYLLVIIVLLMTFAAQKKGYL